MFRKVMICLCSFVFIWTMLVWQLPTAGAAGRTIVMVDELKDLSKLYKTNKAVAVFTPTEAELPRFNGDGSLLKRTETGTTFVYYKVNGKIKSAVMEMYVLGDFYNTGVMEFYVSADDATYTWAQKAASPLETTSGSWRKITYSLDTAYVNNLNARYLRIPIPQNNNGITSEPLLGKVSITYEADAAYKHNDAALQSLSVGAVELPDFDPDTLAYELELAANTAIGPATEVQAVAADNGYAQVSVTQAAYLPGQAQVLVTAEDGLTARTYAVNMSRRTASNDAGLSGITVGGNPLAGFTPSRLEYSVTLPYGTQAGPDTHVIGSVNNQGAALQVQQVTDLPGTAVIQVTAEDGVTVNEYRIHLTALSGIPGMNNTYYVAAGGSDTLGDGSLQHPWRSIQKAADMMTAGDTCYIREGIYYEQVSVQVSGTAEQPIRFAAYPGESVTVSGADPVAGWALDSGDIYKASVHLGFGDANQVFINGKQATEARWPNLPEGRDMLHPDWAVMDSGSLTTLKDSDLTEPDGAWTGSKVMVKGGDGWVLQSATVTGYTLAGGLTFNQLPLSESTFYTPRAGNKYYLYGSRQALDADKEWYYDQANGTLYMAAESFEPGSVTVEAKARDYAFVLRGLSHIELSGIQMYAAGVDTAEGNFLKLDGLKVEYVSQPMVLSGNDNVIRNSILAYSPNAMIEVAGSRNRIINNEIHSTNYLGNGASVNMYGYRNLLAYNSIYDSGKMCVSISGRANIIEYNHIYNAGLLVNDIGMLYSYCFDGDNTEIRYNWIHDNKAETLGEGIYPDNSSTNYLIHHNVVWNVGAALRLNTPSTHMLVYNNTLIGNTGMYGYVYRTDMYGGQFVNNILTGSYEFSEDMVRESNIEGSTDPLFVNRSGYDFRLSADSPARNNGQHIEGITDGYTGTAPDIGAYEYGADWVPGHNFDTKPDAVYQPSQPVYRNRIMKGGFERLTEVEAPWTVTEGQAATVYEYALVSTKKTRAGNYALQVGNKPHVVYPAIPLQEVQATVAAAQAVRGQSSPTGAELSSAITGMNNAYAQLKKETADLLGNAGFEETLSGWMGTGSKIMATDAAKFSGSKSLRSYDRTAYWAGPRIQLPMVNGRTYNISARAKLSEGTDMMQIAFMPNALNPARIMKQKTINSTGWTQVGGVYTVNEGTDYKYGLIGYFTQASLADLYLDEVRIVDVTELKNTVNQAEMLADTLSGQSEAAIRQVIAQGQAELADQEATEEAVAEQVRLLRNAMAVESLVTVQLLDQSIAGIQAAIAEGASLEARIEQTVTGLLPNTTYRLSAWGLMAAAGDSVEMGVRGYGSPEQTVTMDSTLWTRASLEFTTGEGASEATVFFHKPQGMNEVYIDDVALTLASEAPPAAEQIGLIRNPGMESGDTRPWVSFDATVQTVTEQVYSGNYALKAADRETPSSGIAQYVKPAGGKTYEVSAWIKVGSGTDTARLVFQSADNAGAEGTVSSQVVATGPVSSSGWTKLSGTVTTAGGVILLSGALLIDTVEQAEDLYVDDVIMKERLLPTGPGTGDGDADLNAAIADHGGWVLSKGSNAAQFGPDSLTLLDGNARYAGQTYRDAVLTVNMQVYGGAGSWPIINIRNNGVESFASGYAFVIKQDVIELQKRKDGAATMILIGNPNDPGTAGPAVPNQHFTYGQVNLVEVGSLNTDEGVRLILKVNGRSVIDYEDKSDAIRDAGYFSIYQGTAESITLSRVSGGGD
ncbi:MAG: galA [Paenibacillaceae bacterium]|jgi:hypothetical protein|nr:galA [Paenibacillaceae bacterium]